MPRTLEAAAVSVRLRRLWVFDAPREPTLQTSDFAEGWADCTLTRVGPDLIVRSPYDFGTGNPFDGPFGAWLRGRVAGMAGSGVQVTWEYDDRPSPAVRRVKTQDLDVYAPGDPLTEDYPEILDDLRRRIPEDATPEARGAVGALRLVGASRHRLWFAAPTEQERDALGSVVGARAALVTAIQAVQEQEVPLYRVVVDASHRSKSLLL